MKSPKRQLENQAVMKTQDLKQSAGILDDFAVRKDVQTQNINASTEGTIAGMNISNDGTKTTFLGNAGNYNRIGNSTTTSHSLSDEGDLLVTHALEVSNVSHFNNEINSYRSSGANVYTILVEGLTYFNIVPYTDDGIHLAVRDVDGRTNNNLILTNFTNKGLNHDHATLSADPTFFIHSNTSPDTNNTQWISLTHDQTNGVISTGKGHLKINSISGGILMPNATENPLNVASSGIIFVSGGALYFKGSAGTLTVVAPA